MYYCVNKDVFIRFDYSCGVRIDRIQCATEDSLKNIDDPEEEALILQRRAGRSNESALIIESLYMIRGGRPFMFEGNYQGVLRPGSAPARKFCVKLFGQDTDQLQSEG